MIRRRGARVIGDREAGALGPEVEARARGDQAVELVPRAQAAGQAERVDLGEQALEHQAAHVAGGEAGPGPHGQTGQDRDVEVAGKAQRAGRWSENQHDQAVDGKWSKPSHEFGQLSKPGATLNRLDHRRGDLKLGVVVGFRRDRDAHQLLTSRAEESSILDHRRHDIMRAKLQPRQSPANTAVPLYLTQSDLGLAVQLLLVEILMSDRVSPRVPGTMYQPECTRFRNWSIVKRIQS